MNDDWREQALCAGKETNLFFPESGLNAAIRQSRMMKAFCKACPVRIDCLHYAINTEEPFGIWGGLSAKERKVVFSTYGIMTIEQVRKLITANGE